MEAAMPGDDEVVEDIQGVSTMAATSLMRAGETLIRSAQDQAQRRAQQLAQQSEDAQRRFDAQGLVADRFYAQASDPQWMRAAEPAQIAQAWRGAQEWAELDSARFGPKAEAINAAYRDAYGWDLNTYAGRTGDPEFVADAAAARVVQVRADGPELTREEQGDRERTLARKEREEAAALVGEAERVERERDRIASDYGYALERAGVTDEPSDADATVIRDGLVAEHTERATGLRAEAAQHTENAVWREQLAGAIDKPGQGPVAAGGLEYNTAQRRAQSAAAMDHHGVAPEARDARLMADHLNGRNPAGAAASAKAPSKAADAKTLAHGPRLEKGAARTR
jgi:hypothetical protein